MIERFPGALERAPEGPIAKAVGRIVDMMVGEPSAIDAIELAMDGIPDFHRQVYVEARSIVRGTTVSYGELAARLGRPGAARAVGQAMANNPFALIVPCHRVLAAGGKRGGFSAHGGIATKDRLLALERIRLTCPLEEGLLYRREEALDHLGSVDARLGRSIERTGAFTLSARPTESLFRALAESIVYQQLTGKAAATIYGRLESILDGSVDAERVWNTDSETLRQAGLSRSKEASIRDLARHVLDGTIPTLEQARRMEDLHLIDTLTKVRGIGRWTVEMILIFRLGRPDVLPLGDLGVRKGLSRILGLDTLVSQEELARRGARWAPYRSVASWYLWRALES